MPPFAPRRGARYGVAVFPRRRPVAGLVLALALATAGVLVPGAPPIVRAGGGLVTVMDATYDVQPESALVHVTIDAVSTSFERDTPEGRVYYAGLSFRSRRDRATRPRRPATRPCRPR